MARIHFSAGLGLRARRGAASLLIAAVFSGCAARSPCPCAGGKVVDLSHAFDENTVYWPTSEPFRLERVHFGRTEAGYWYAANKFSTAEHGGTHLDAPIHFAEKGSDAASIPASRLIATACVIDMRGRAAADRDALLRAEDIEAYEARYGPIQPGEAVLVLTGFSRYWPDAAKYLGTAKRGKEAVAELHFPGLGSDAARLLAERRVAFVGIDTASIDHGPSRDFRTHRILGEADIPVLENLTRLEELPPRGACVIALPMKIRGGSGGPCRVVAVVP